MYKLDSPLIGYRKAFPLKYRPQLAPPESGIPIFPAVPALPRHNIRAASPEGSGSGHTYCFHRGFRQKKCHKNNYMLQVFARLSLIAGLIGLY